ncbi:MAG: SIMPL domain-containing protein [Rhodoferax sp.]|nr:SIMPL domain-containing protein [Rhodoferax sp.]MDD2879311.1 SIMPL domain-containing protein [Rhodoferax sp.]
MKNTIKSIAACTLFIWATASFSQNLTPPELSQRVTLSASASVQIAQDVLTLSLTTTREGADAQTVQTQLKAALDDALTLARREAKSSATEVRTGRFGLSPRYDRNGKMTGWQGSAELVLQGRDFARMGEIAGKLQTLTVASASFGLTPEQRQGAETLAQSQAIAQFRQRASEAAKSFGYSSYSLVEANINAGDSGGGRPPMMAMSARTVAESAPVPLEAGLTSVTVTVSGSVHLK